MGWEMVMARFFPSVVVAATLVVGVMGAQAAGATGTANSSSCQGYNVSAFATTNTPFGAPVSMDARLGTLVGYVQSAANCGK